MYKATYFSDASESQLYSFIQEHNFVLVTGMGPQGPVATQVPVLVSRSEGSILLEGHFMKNSDHHLAFSEDPRALVVFTGPHCYVSASWYTNPQIASTWNYMTVHARGSLELLDESASKDILRELTDHYEPAGSKASYQALSPDYVDRMAKAIIGFKIRVESLDHVFKLSQNRDLESRRKIVAELSLKNDPLALAIAREMEKRLPDF